MLCRAQNILWGQCNKQRENSTYKEAWVIYLNLMLSLQYTFLKMPLKLAGSLHLQDDWKNMRCSCEYHEQLC